MPGIYQHPASPARDGEAARLHAQAAREQHAASQLHDRTACGLAHPWPAAGTVPSTEDNRGTTGDGKRYRYSSAHNGFVMLASTPDEVITVATNADDAADAAAQLAGVPARVIAAAADQLHVETDGHGAPWILNRVIAEARS
jgi:hypothetical protein